VRTLTKTLLCRLAVMNILAVVLFVGLLWWNSTFALPHIAAQTSATQLFPESFAAAFPSDISATWDSTEPYTQLVPLGDKLTELTRWDIYTHHVFITFPEGLLNAAAIFTFTPKTSESLPAPLMALDRFFTLEGDWVIRSQNVGAQDVSFQGGKYPEFELEYPNDLGEISERTLGLYYYTTDFGTPPTYIWKLQEGFVIAEKNKAVFKLGGLGKFGFGGYRALCYLPLVLNAATGK
jgi:hypothetical protein